MAVVAAIVPITVILPITLVAFHRHQLSSGRQHKHTKSETHTPLWSAVWSQTLRAWGKRGSLPKQHGVCVYVHINAHKHTHRVKYTHMDCLHAHQPPQFTPQSPVLLVPGNFTKRSVNSEPGDKQRSYCTGSNPTAHSPYPLVHRHTNEPTQSHTKRLAHTQTHTLI